MGIYTGTLGLARAKLPDSQEKGRYSPINDMNDFVCTVNFRIVSWSYQGIVKTHPKCRLSEKQAMGRMVPLLFLHMILF